MSYTLLNKKTNKKLTHPVVGLWFTENLEEARDTLDACLESLNSMNLNFLNKDFVIIDVETEKEIK